MNSINYEIRCKNDERGKYTLVVTGEKIGGGEFFAVNGDTPEGSITHRWSVDSIKTGYRLESFQYKHNAVQLAEAADRLMTESGKTGENHEDYRFMAENQTIRELKTYEYFSKTPDEHKTPEEIAADREFEETAIADDF